MTTRNKQAQRKNRSVVALLALLLFALRAAVAPDFMLAPMAGGDMAIMPCPGLSASVSVPHAAMGEAADHSGSHHDRKGDACPFAAALHVAFYGSLPHVAIPAQPSHGPVSALPEQRLATAIAPPFPARGPPVTV